jgi:NADPH:quinone reductase
MKAVVTKKFGSPPEMAVEERPRPTFKNGSTLVRMHSATINQLSNTIRRGELGAAKAPLVLGNEGSGVVEESGHFNPGTRVAIYGGGELGITQDGLFQQWVLIEDKVILELPDILNWDEGAALTVNYLTAYQALTRIAKLQKSEGPYFRCYRFGRACACASSQGIGRPSHRSGFLLGEGASCQRGRSVGDRPLFAGLGRHRARSH